MLRRRRSKKPYFLAVCAWLYLSAVGCLPEGDQLTTAFMNATQAFVLELGITTIETVFTNYND